MEIQVNSMQHTTPLKIRHHKLTNRKALPLPILSLQTKTTQTPQRYSHSTTVKQNKSPIRQHFKQIIRILNQSKKNTSYVPNSLHTPVQSNEMIRKKPNQGFHPRMTNHLMLKTHLINTMQKIYNSKTLQSQQPSPLHFLKQNIPNLHRTIRFNRKNKKQEDDKKSQRFMKWQSFCTSISYHHKTVNNLPSLQMKKKFKQRSYLKKRSQSTIRSSRNQEVNGWQHGPVRYHTELDYTDFGDIY